MAVVSPHDFERLGAVEDFTAKNAFISLNNTASHRTAYARVHASEEVEAGTIALQGYIAKNCGVEAGQIIDVEVWDVSTQATIAQKIELREVGPPAIAFEQEKLQICQRLIHSGLPVAAGHTFSLPIRDKEPIFEVVAVAPAGSLVVCSPETEIILIDANIIDTPEQSGDITFNDIGGLQEPLRRIKETALLPARHPEVFVRLGVRPPKGILLYGPPGSGKTLLARAVAKSFGASFFHINGPEVLSKYYGETERRLRDIFASAANAAPSVIFIDELDAIAPSRERVSGDLEVRIVSQLLTMMDGLNQRGQVIVIGATNRLSAIDPALRRPGRFDREIEIPPPDTSGREAILRIHTRSMQLASDVCLERLARLTIGFVGADLASLCQEAALAVIRRVFSFGANGEIIQRGESLSVTEQDFQEALRMVQPSAFRELDQPEVSVTWDDIVGLESVKESLIELIEWPLVQRERMQRFGIASGQNLLLTGPPMSAKTSLVIALAKRLNISLIYIRADDLLSQWIGDAEQIIRRAFRKARLTSPSIVLIDSFEQILAFAEGGNHLLQRILGRIQYELAQIGQASNVFVVVAARSTQDHIAALQNNPAFTHVIEIEAPEVEDIRAAIKLKIGHLLATDIALDGVAERHRGLAIGQVIQFCEEAGRSALRENPDATLIESRHVDSAWNRATKILSYPMKAVSRKE